MTPPTHCFAQLSNEELSAELPRLAASERRATAALVAALAEMDARQLHLREGYSSLFAYCTGRLGLSEAATCRRVEAARASRRYPVILERLVQGTLTLTAVGILARHLTPENHLAVLDDARGKSKRELEELAARLAPRPDLPSSVRKLPCPRVGREPALDGPAEERVVVPPTATTAAGGTTAMRPAATAASAPNAAVRQLAPSSCPLLEATAADRAAVASPPPPVSANPPLMRRPAIVRPLAPGRYQIQVTVSAETHAKLLRARDLLRHALPNGDAAIIIDRALTLLVDQLEKTKFGARNVKTRTSESPRKRRGHRATAAAEPGAPSGDGDTSIAAPAAGATLDAAAQTSRVSVSPVDAPPCRLPAEDRPSAPSASPPPTPRSRHISAAVRREVWARSGGRCEYTSDDGHRCDERGFLEYHHRVPFAVGGVSSATNVVLYCRSHNRHEADLFFGPEVMKARSGARSNSQPQEGETRTVAAPSPATVEAPRDGSWPGN